MFPRWQVVVTSQEAWPMLVLGVSIIWQFPENFSLRLNLSLVKGLYTEPQVYLHCAYTRATLLGL
jgi:hypothetical protein